MRTMLKTVRRGFGTTSSNFLPLSELTAITPVDGRYGEKLKALRGVFSEYALIQKRVKVEVEWVCFMSEERLFKEIPVLSDSALMSLRKIADDFDLNSALRVKEIEKVTNHDVKAVEYFIKERIEGCAYSHQLLELSEYVHFGCTSEDINNLSYGLIIKDALENTIEQTSRNVIMSLRNEAYNCKDIPMLSRTHGQPATPTTLGKELANFAVRLAKQRKRLYDVEILGKFNGAVGNFAAHYVCDKSINWMEVSSKFVSKLGLVANNYTTQIEPHDFVGEVCDSLEGYNQVLLDCSKDIWGYISLGYFSQKNLKGQVGSSTMPHKTNPIDFENCEGNLELSNALLAFFKRKLTLSRYQRDLSDSTVLRAIGMALSHSVLAYESFHKGFSKISPNEAQILLALEDNVEVLAEPIQMVLRKHKESGAYEKLKELTKGKKLSLSEIRDFIKTLDLDDVAKSNLLDLTPAKYTGLASMQVDLLDNELSKLDFISG